MDFKFGNLIFSSNFDSGNLLNVEQVPISILDDNSNNTSSISQSDINRPDYEFNVWTKPDCHGTEYENGNRTWFYFSVKGYTSGKLIKINIKNLNRQQRLYSQGFCPLYKTESSSSDGKGWLRIRSRPTWENVENNFNLTFLHRFTDVKCSTTYFAFCYPWSYTECQNQFAKLDNQYRNIMDSGYSALKEMPTSTIYYFRELLTTSLEMRRIDLITITDLTGIRNDREPHFDEKLFPKRSKRPMKFRDKKVFVLTSRVHPGETPASHVFNGFLEFILRPNDARAIQLRKQYIFKLIPLLNPDGVFHGHYRTDTRGVNLNRVYLSPDFNYHPSIYAAKSLLVYHHIMNSTENQSKIDHVAGKVFSIVDLLTDEVLSEPKSQNETNYNAYLITDEKSDSDVAYFSKFNRNLVMGKSLETNNEAVSDVYIDFENSFRHQMLVQDTMVNESFKTNEEELNQKDESKEMDEVNNVNKNMLKNALSDSKLTEFINSTKLGSQIPVKKNYKFHNVSASMQALRPSIVSMKFSNSLSPKRDSGLVGNGKKVMLDPVQLAQFKRHLMQSSDVNKHHHPHLGNEGSDEEEEMGSTSPDVGNVVNSLHLSLPELLQISPYNSGIAYYVDLHGHCSKRGCFMYGNCLDNELDMVNNLVFPMLISLNSPHFDFGGCNFSLKNMYTKDKRDGASKAGAGRVAIGKHLGLVHSYTLECNYNTGRVVNPITPATKDDGKATPIVQDPTQIHPPKYTPVHFEDVGKATAIAVLDMSETNPWSRILSSDYRNLSTIREFIRKYISNHKCNFRSYQGFKSRTTKQIKNQIQSQSLSQSQSQSQSQLQLQSQSQIQQQQQQQQQIQQHESHRRHSYSNGASSHNLNNVLANRKSYSFGNSNTYNAQLNSMSKLHSSGCSNNSMSMSQESDVINKAILKNDSNKNGYKFGKEQIYNNNSRFGYTNKKTVEPKKISCDTSSFSECEQRKMIDTAVTCMEKNYNNFENSINFPTVSHVDHDSVSITGFESKCTLGLTPTELEVLVDDNNNNNNNRGDSKEKEEDNDLTDSGTKLPIATGSSSLLEQEKVEKLRHILKRVEPNLKTVSEKNSNIAMIRSQSFYKTFPSNRGESKNSAVVIRRRRFSNNYGDRRSKGSKRSTSLTMDKSGFDKNQMTNMNK